MDPILTALAPAAALDAPPPCAGAPASAGSICSARPRTGASTRRADAYFGLREGLAGLFGREVRGCAPPPRPVAWHAARTDTQDAT
jgi:hypothetical protein